MTIRPRTVSPKCSNLRRHLDWRSGPRWNPLFIIGRRIVGMVFKDMVRAGVVAAVGKHRCSDVVVVDGWEKGEGGLVGKGGTQDGAGGHVGVGVRKPVGDGVVDGEAGEGTREGTRVLDRHYKTGSRCSPSLYCVADSDSVNSPCPYMGGLQINLLSP